MATVGKGAKRANGEGTITYDATRKRYDVRVMVDGKRRKVSAPTQAEAWRRAKELRAAPTAQGTLPPRPTVGEWLDHWRAHVLPGTVKQTTENGYADIITKYLKPELGRRKLADLTPAHVRELLAVLERGTANHKPLSANTRRLALAVLRRALKVAEREGYVTRNVAALVDGVRLDRKRGRSLTPDEAQKLMAEIAASDEMTSALLTLLISTGMRKGEALGLRWGDVNLKAGTAHVRRVLSRRPKTVGEATLYLAESPKTSESDRVVELDPLAVDALKRWKAAQRAARIACPPMPPGTAWGLGFPDDLVFTGPRGQALDLSRPNDLLEALTESAGLGMWTPHELRHTAASLMLGAGVALPTVSRVLGHSSIGVTMNTYGHLVSGEKRAAATALAGVLNGGRPAAAGNGS